MSAGPFKDSSVRHIELNADLDEDPHSLRPSSSERMFGNRSEYATLRSPLSPVGDNLMNQENRG